MRHVFLLFVPAFKARTGKPGQLSDRIRNALKGGNQAVIVVIVR